MSNIQTQIIIIYINIAVIYILLIVTNIFLRKIYTVLSDLLIIVGRIVDQTMINKVTAKPVIVPKQTEEKIGTIKRPTAEELEERHKPIKEQQEDIEMEQTLDELIHG